MKQPQMQVFFLMKQFHLKKRKTKKEKKIKFPLEFSRPLHPIFQRFIWSSEIHLTDLLCRGDFVIINEITGNGLENTSYEFLVIISIVFLNPKQVSIPIRPISKYSLHFIKVSPWWTPRPIALGSQVRKMCLWRRLIFHICEMRLFSHLIISTAFLSPVRELNNNFTHWGN